MIEGEKESKPKGILNNYYSRPLARKSWCFEAFYKETKNVPSVLHGTLGYSF